MPTTPKRTIAAVSNMPFFNYLDWSNPEKHLVPRSLALTLHLLKVDPSRARVSVRETGPLDLKIEGVDTAEHGLQKVRVN